MRTSHSIVISLVFFLFGAIFILHGTAGITGAAIGSDIKTIGSCFVGLIFIILSLLFFTEQTIQKRKTIEDVLEKDTKK